MKCQKKLPQKLGYHGSTVVTPDHVETVSELAYESHLEKFGEVG